MARTTNISNYYIRIDPRTGYTSDPVAYAKAECEAMAAQIKRHVDDWKYVDVEQETEDVCEHCGGVWTEASQVFNGGCCQADEDAEKARLATLERAEN